VAGWGARGARSGWAHRGPLPPSLSPLPARRPRLPPPPAAPQAVPGGRLWGLPLPSLAPVRPGRGFGSALGGREGGGRCQFGRCSRRPAGWGPQAVNVPAAVHTAARTRPGVQNAASQICTDQFWPATPARWAQKWGAGGVRTPIDRRAGGLAGIQAWTNPENSGLPPIAAHPAPPHSHAPAKAQSFNRPVYHCYLPAACRQHQPCRPRRQRDPLSVAVGRACALRRAS
jgi:hypothetical protein